jgi:hypothetical protein
LISKLFSPGRNGSSSGNKVDELKSLINQQVSSYFKRLANLFIVPRIRRATTAAAVVMTSQQLCGINIVSFYSATILPAPNKNNPTSVHNNNRNALWMALGIYLIAALLASLISPN